MFPLPQLPQILLTSVSTQINMFSLPLPCLSSFLPPPVPPSRQKKKKKAKPVTFKVIMIRKAACGRLTLSYFLMELW